ncbi:MAG TPA: DNA-binding protein WhiA [Erysipelothrix sp.]
MSFSSEVKHEITTNEFDVCCQRAQLSAFLQVNSNLLIRDKKLFIKVEISNATTAKQVYQLVKSLYDVEVDLKMKRKENLEKNNVYTLTIVDALSILEDLGIYETFSIKPVPDEEICRKDCCARSYLAGAFLASGSINAPTTPNYHLEMSSHAPEMAAYLQTLLARFGIDGKLTERRNRTVVYVKVADQIADFLKAIGAYQKTMEFEDIRIQRDFTNSLTRLENCEIANEVKTIQAGNKQVDAIIKLIEANQYSQLDDKLREVAELRMDNPESSLNELIDKYESTYGDTISKSGLQHRFKRIIEMANKIDIT